MAPRACPQLLCELQYMVQFQVWMAQYNEQLFHQEDPEAIFATVHQAITELERGGVGAAP